MAWFGGAPFLAEPYGFQDFRLLLPLNRGLSGRLPRPDGLGRGSLCPSALKNLYDLGPKGRHNLCRRREPPVARRQEPQGPKGRHNSVSQVLR